MKKNILHGLKPSVILGMIGYYKPQGFHFTEVENPEAPALKIFKMIAEAIGEDGLKGTVKKNLPLQLCQKIQAEFYPESAKKYPVRSEQEYAQLSVLRWLSQKSKLIYFRKGKFVLSRDAKKLIASNKWGSIYQQLFQTFMTQYDWRSGGGWRAPWQDGSYIQANVVLGLYLLQYFGDEEKQDRFYAQEYLSLLPVYKEQFLMEANENNWRADIDDLEFLVTRRLVHNFANFFGLVSVRKVGERFDEKYFVKKTVLLDRIFHPERTVSEADVYTFTITLSMEKKVVREIQIQGDATFRELHDAIFLAYHRHDPHLFSFYRKNKKRFRPSDRRDVFEVTHAMMIEGASKDSNLLADEKTTRIDAVGMTEGEEWEYLFDFGDSWEHDLVLKKIARPEEGVFYPMVDIISGESPSQYWFEEE